MHLTDGKEIRPKKIKEELYKKLKDFDETVKVFDVIKEQNEYLK